jgi:hypothetical protein
MQNMLHPSSNQEQQTEQKKFTNFISISGSKCGGGMEKPENDIFSD